MYPSYVIASILIITVGQTSVKADENDDVKPLVYFSLIISRGENGYNSSGAIPAVDIALEAIESNGLLPGYSLTYETVRNSKVSAKCLFVGLDPP